MDGSDKIYKFQYQQTWSSIIMILMIMGPLTAFLIHQSLYGNIIVDIAGFKLSRSTSNIVLICGSIFCGLIFILGLFSSFFRIVETNFLTITPKKIIIPPIGFNRKTHIIPKEEIIDISEIDIVFQQMIQIDTTTGKRAIPKVLLKSNKSYKELKDILLKNSGND
jgi:hypothetical protein